MKMKVRFSYLLTISFTYFITFNTAAQLTGVRSSHSLSAGSGIKMLNDDFLSLSSARVTATSFDYSYSNNTAHRKKTISIGVEQSSRKTGKIDVSSKELNFQYTNTFSVLRNRKGRWNNYTGYGIVINPQYIRLADQYSWATVGSLTLHNSLNYAGKKNYASLDISIPLAGFGSRPKADTEYGGSANDMLYNSFSRLEFIAPHNLLALTVSLQYQHLITEGLYFKVAGSYGYKELSTGDHFLEQAYRFKAGVSYYLR